MRKNSAAAAAAEEKEKVAVDMGAGMKVREMGYGSVLQSEKKKDDKIEVWPYGRERVRLVFVSIIVMVPFSLFPKAFLRFLHIKREKEKES